MVRVSFTALAWASKQSTGRASDKLVLYGLADRHNEEVDLAYPSVAWLCEFGDLNRKTVIAALARLEAAGIIADSGKRVGKTGQIKAYRLALQTVPKTEQSRKRNSPKKSRKQSQKRDTEPVRNLCLSNDKQYTREADWPEIPDWMPVEPWNGFIAMRKARKKYPTDRAVTTILNKLERWRSAGHDVGDILDRATEGCWTTIYEPKTQSNDNGRGGSLADIGDEVRRMFNG